VVFNKIRCRASGFLEYILAFFWGNANMLQTELWCKKHSKRKENLQITFIPHSQPLSVRFKAQNNCSF
jgi:hypothetical protein